MNWEESKACTPLKQDILNAWFAQEKRYFLTGGSALGIFYLHHRRSYDLDFFTSDEVSNKEIQNLIHRISETIGATYKVIRSSPDFQRFLMTREQDSELIDVVTDRAPQLDVHKNRIGTILVDTPREIIANKLTTLLSRSETKDIIDLYFLEQAGFDILAAIPDARAKDGGWDPAMVSLLLNNITLSEVSVLLIKELDMEDLKAFLQRLRLAIAKHAMPS